MTTIATDGRSIAADGRVTGGTELQSDTFCKIVELPDGSYVGGAGHTQAATMAMRELYSAVEQQRSPVACEGDYRLLRLHPSGAIQLYGGQLDAPFFVEAPFAIGSGGDFARGALAAGASLRKAMKVAARFDVATGPLNQHITP